MPWSSSTLWVDAGGSQSIFRIRTNSGLGAIFPALLSCSRADYMTCWEGPETINPAPTPSTLDYQPVKPTALLYFGCMDGTTAIVRIPAPDIVMFLADRQTIDASNLLHRIACCRKKEG